MDEKVRAEAARRPSGEDWKRRAHMLDAALGAIDDQVFVLDLSGRNIYANLPGAAAVGLGRTELVGRSWRELGTAPSSVVAAFELLLENVFATGRRRTEVYPVPSPAGLRDYQVTLTPVFGDDGTTVEYVVDVVTDVTAPQEGGNGADGDFELTRRQREILELVARGFANREISEMLMISVRTVETHRRDIARKTGLRTRAQVFAYAREHQWV